MRGEEEFVYADFSGGVNLSAAPYLVAENQARDALNVNSNSNSQLRKRTGFSTLASLTASPASFTGAPHTAAGAETSSGDFIVFVGPVAGPNDRFVASSTSGTLTDITGTAPTASTRWDIAQGAESSDNKGPIFAMNGVDTPQEWNGDTSTNFANWTAATGTLPTTGKYLIYHANRLWCSSGSALPSRLRYSGLTGSSTNTGAWDANDFVDFHPTDGQVITGIGTLGPYLLVFKEHKIFRVYDTITGANSEIINGVGCSAHRSIVETPAGTIFLDQDGVYSTNGETVTLLSDPVNTLIADAANFSSFQYAAAVLHDNSYWLSLSTDGNTNNRTLQYDLNTQAWWVHDCASNEFATISVSTGERIYSANPNATNAQRAFTPAVFADSGSNYAGTSFWKAPHFVWGMPHKQKRVRQVRIDGTGQWTLGTATDYTDNFLDDAGEVWVASQSPQMTYAPITSLGDTYAPSSTLGDLYAGVSSAVTTRRYYTPCVGDACTFKISNDDTADLGVYSYTIAINYRKD